MITGLNCVKWICWKGKGLKKMVNIVKENQMWRLLPKTQLECN
jgi:hypothetical protein